MYSNDGMSNHMIIEARNLEECREKLYRKYGDTFHISNWERIVKDSILGLKQKEMIRAYYTVSHNMRGYGSSEPFNDRMQAARENTSAYSAYGSTMRGSSPSSPYSGMAAQGGGQTESFSKNQEAILKKLVGNFDIVRRLGEMQEQMNGMNRSISKLMDFSTGKKVHPSIEKIDGMLKKNEFTDSYIESMNERISAEMSVGELDDFDLLQKNVLNWIGESIKIAPRYERKGSKLCHTIILVGPTGVGKTTAIAKMAATIMKKAKRDRVDPPSVVMITTDKDRVAAKEQLEHYAEAIEADFFEAPTQEDFEDLYNSYKTKSDFIFVDTNGYSPRDLENLGRLHKLLDVEGLKADIYLVVSASTKASDLENIIKNYDSFDYRSVIITKCDETVSLGNILSVISEKKKSVSLIVHGQKTLNTIEPATPSYFLKRITDFTVGNENSAVDYDPEKDFDDE